jgi:hypothetical protein
VTRADLTIGGGKDRLVDDTTPGIRRVCVAFDLEDDGRRSATEVQGLRRQLAAAIAGSCSLSGLDRILLNHQAMDEVEILLLAAGIDEPRAVTSLINGFFQALRQLNGQVRAGARVRLKIAVHEGITVLAAGGFVGRVVTKTCRMLAAPPLRDALARCPRSDLAVLLSDQVFEDIDSFDHCLPLSEFEQVQLDDPSLRFGGSAWIFVPDHGG